MALATGTRLGPYEILAAIGAGGMGEVYKARDTRLDRTVAVKILPEALATDPQFHERFDREARAISQLAHPHICTLYDVGEQAGTSFLVMEFIEGESLEQRLKKGALPLDDALRIAIQIADALDTAHRNGIVHRDLKPGNVMLTRAGAKLLDFGLAKAGPSTAVATGPSMLPTTPPNLTAQGTILGTFQYMAPEQLEGQEADARTDIFALGAVVYEMVTGRKAFEGKSQASLIGAILKDTPAPISSVQPIAPPALDRIVSTCLAKDPEERWQSARDLSRELKWVADRRYAPPEAGGSRRSGRPAAIAVAGAVAALLATVVAGALYLRRPSVVDPFVVRFAIAPPSNATLVSSIGSSSMALSPDGRFIVFVASGAGSGNTLWVRSLDAVQPRRLVNAFLATYPFWSADGKSIGFFDSAYGKLKSVDPSNGTVQTLCDLPGVGLRGGTWNRDGVILFGSGAVGGIFRCSARGGQPAQLTTPDTAHGETAHRFPVFLPDGRHFLYSVAPANTIRMASLDSKDTHDVTTADSQAAFVASASLLLFTHQSSLLAQPFDLQRGRLLGEPVPIAEGVLPNSFGGEAAFAASDTGVLAYRSGAAGVLTQLTWVDRTGKPIGTVGSPGPNRSPLLSPNQKRITVETPDAAGRTDIWMLDVADGTPHRLTFDPANEIYAVWSPDGDRIMFASDREGGVFRLYQARVDVPGRDEPVTSADAGQPMAPYSWSRDGRYVLFRGTFGGRTSLGVLPLEGDRTPHEYDRGSAALAFAQISPDGRWVAYNAAREGVMVQSFPAVGGGRWQITSDGTMPRWGPDQKELFYLAPDGHLMAVPIAGGPTPSFGASRPLFETRMLGFGPNTRQQYDVASDSQRFLINVPVEDPSSSITVMLNWTSTLKNQLGAR